MSYLSLDDVSYSYDNKNNAVESVNLEFELGEAVAIIGQNGAGKTTTVKMMNGLIRPDKGRVLLDGKDTKGISVAQLSHHVGYVFQNPDEQIFQDSVEKEIAFSLKKQKLPQTEIITRVKDAARLCHLDNKLNEHPYNLPYSQRKFVTIAAIIAMNPEVMVFDEPTAGQDHNSIIRLNKIIKKLTSMHKLVITITHDMSFVVNNFKHVIVFAQAHKQKEGSPAEIFSDESLLRKSKLEPPVIGQLAKKLGFSNVLTVTDLLRVVN